MLHTQHPEQSIQTLYHQINGLMRRGNAFERVVAGYRLGIHAMTAEEERLIRETAYAVLNKARCSLTIDKIAELVAAKGIPVCKDNLDAKIKLCVHTYPEFEDAGMDHYAAGSKNPRPKTKQSRPWTPRKTGTIVELLRPWEEPSNGAAYIPSFSPSEESPVISSVASVPMEKPLPQVYCEPVRPGKGNRKKKEVKSQEKVQESQPGSLRYELYEIVKNASMPISASQAVEMLRNKIDVNANTPFLINMYFETRKDEYRQIVPGFYKAIEKKPQ